MNRRTLLSLLSGILGAFSAAVVAIPGVRYALGAITGGREERSLTARVILLANLTPGQPTQVPVFGARRDAWTLYPQEMIGMLWIVRHGDQQTPPEQTRLTVLTADCPHMGCVIGMDAASGELVCPCHHAHFNIEGKRLPGPQDGSNASPRDMDALAYRIVADGAAQQHWVEVDFQRFQYGIAEAKPR